jgi:hypothetical protein
VKWIYWTAEAWQNAAVRVIGNTEVQNNAHSLHLDTKGAKKKVHGAFRHGLDERF